MAVYGDLTNVAAEWSFPNASDRRLDGAVESSWRSPPFLLGPYNNNGDIPVCQHEVRHLQESTIPLGRDRKP